MTWRRAVIVLAALLFLGAVVAWKLTHQHDPQLVGRWKADPVPIFVMSVFREWEFLTDGTGERSGKLRPDDEAGIVPSPASQSQTTGVAPQRRVQVIHMRGRFRWWTRGDRLFVQLGSSRSFWSRMQERLTEFFNSVTGQPVMRVTNPIWEYQFAVEGDGRVRMTPVSLPTQADISPFELTPLAGDVP